MRALLAQILLTCFAGKSSDGSSCGGVHRYVVKLSGNIGIGQIFNLFNPQGPIVRRHDCSAAGRWCLNELVSRMSCSHVVMSRDLVSRKVEVNFLKKHPFQVDLCCASCCMPHLVLPHTNSRITCIYLVVVPASHGVAVAKMVFLHHNRSNAAPPNGLCSFSSSSSLSESSH